MNKNEMPYVTRCSFCNQGLLRFMRCHECEGVVAVCDECELVWRNIAAVHSNPRCPSSGSFPTCPICTTDEATWTQLDFTQLVQACLTHLMVNKST